MTDASAGQTAWDVADQLRGKLDAPWDVFGERIVGHEVHFTGGGIEMLRAPVRTEGFGLRVLRPLDGELGVGFASSTDLTADSVARAVRDAETSARYTRFPAKAAELPLPKGDPLPALELSDESLWRDAPGLLSASVESLLAAFEGRTDGEPTFGSVRASLVETSQANSSGLESSYRHTGVEVEVAVKSKAGPEGRSAGEFWVNESFRRLEPNYLPGEVDHWCRSASDARAAGPTPGGDLTVVMPPPVLADVVPAILGFRLSGAAQLRQMLVPPGTHLGPEELRITDDPHFPWSTGTAPIDDEGTRTARTEIATGGATTEVLYDVLHGSAFGRTSTGHARRSNGFDGIRFAFARPPRPRASSLAIAAGSAGPNPDLMETIGDGLWIEQLGWAFPDELSGAFGGEIRLGYRIRGGKRREPVRGGTIGGLLFAPEGSPSFLGNLVAIGSAPTLVGNYHAPTLAAKEIRVAGAD